MEYKTPFDYVNSIKKGIVPNADFKSHSPFVAVRSLSMDFKNLPMCAAVNKYTFLDMSNENHYRLLACLPWYDSRKKYIKKSGVDKNMEELVDHLLTYWKYTSIKKSEIYDGIKNGVLTKEKVSGILQQLGLDPKKIKKLVKVI